jgi:fluoroacetyl-CoA thioesterase
MGLTEGIERTDEFRVEDDLLTDVGGTLPLPVLSTPGMVSMMEWTATQLVADDLPDQHTTVGFEVCIKHVGGALEGATCTVTARLREFVDMRKLRFDVEVNEGARTIGVGTHERRIVPVGRS